MLRRLKIGGRLNLLIAVPLLAMVALAAIGYVALQRVSVRGDDYQSLKQAQDLVADTNPPSASLLEAWANVNAIGVVVASEGFTADSAVAINEYLAAVQQSRVDFEQAMAQWAQEDLPQRVQIRLVQLGSTVGTGFFDAVDSDLKSAIDSQDPDAVLAVIQSLQWRYDVQQTGVDRAIAWAEPEVARLETSSDSFVGTLVVIAGGAAALLILLTLLLSVRVRRTIVRPIRALAAQARQVASKDLPDAVHEMGTLADGEEAPHLPPFEVGTRDELADLGASFTSVQDTAVELAAEQAMARRIVSENLVNIARRNQALLVRTLGFISTLEHGERDPDVLENLFRIDHLATRMRRNAQSLLVLAGAEPTRLFSPAVPIGDVVRAALSEVENYSQVDLADLGEISVQGAVAGEVSHLLAELLENATTFSSGERPVTVVGRAVADGHQLAIIDYGIGMEPAALAEANRRLNELSEFDREANKMLGFQVVGRLAARHDIKVMLTTTPGGTGLTAIIRLPQEILEATPQPGSTPVADFSGMSAVLAAPLPVTTSVPVMAPMAPAAVTTAEMPVATAVATLPPLSTPPDPLLPPMPTDEPGTTAAGLTRRVRGAQLPDLGVAPIEAATPRAADDVRNTLTSLQRGVDLGRSQGAE